MRALWALLIAALAFDVSLAYYTVRQPSKSIEWVTSLEKDYGYGGKIDNIHRYDMNQLNGSVYLDYTGSGLYRTS